MENENPIAPRVAVLGGLDGCRRIELMLSGLRGRSVPGVEVDLVAGHRLPHRRYDLLHVCAPGPAGAAALAEADAHGVPAVTAYHASAAGYGSCRAVLSPSAAADEVLRRHGVDAGRIHRWRAGVDRSCFTPAAYQPGTFPDSPVDTIHLLYVGRLHPGKGVELLGDAFLRARELEPRLHLVIAGEGPEERTLRHRLGPDATVLGWVAPQALARLYASADLFVWPCVDDLDADAVLQAQACGLPVLAVDAGGAAELVESGRSGCLVPPAAEALSEAIVGLGRRAALRERLITGALMTVREASWEASLARLAGIWRAVVSERAAVASAA